ncbi:MAG: hypothetical protein ACRDS0_23565 [Pseudonocardiaceae bacterium]
MHEVPDRYAAGQHQEVGDHPAVAAPPCLGTGAVRRAAQEDPEGFVDIDRPLVIDEAQRVLELFLAVRRTSTSGPGRVGSCSPARPCSRPPPDALPGRMETVELWPLSQGEIVGRPDRFVDAAFARGPGLRHDSATSRADYARRLVRGLPGSRSSRRAAQRPVPGLIRPPRSLSAPPP